ncbi:carboxylesterase/lipase family protein [Govanella unica]|uniref:Carboxylic ester hydrolase n=1 Tax=Govanella unica TaxID=2975056 RepID=A0A9X3Z862_9PROT|nr:carboxylesterase family protein [Govania unica]MDA5195015.1 carboxylesterase family protein [Govania unica]
MMKINQVAAVLVSTVFMISTAAHAQSVVKTDSGAVSGIKAGDVIAYKGIPFAKPPVGDLRWRAPEPVTPWKGVKVADKYRADCMQVMFKVVDAPLAGAPSEDCLYTNIWTSAHASAKKRPVMVWVYGGGFVNGGSSPAVYAGDKFAQSDVVFVSFNYRLGRFGYFAHPALSKEAGAAPHGNYAILDQIAALKWVQRNIAAFGGDPDNVTILGQSAGGMAVHALVTTPLAKGLFSKAIVMSGGGRKLLGPTMSSKQAETIGAEFAKSKGVEGDAAPALKALRALSADQVMDGLSLMTLFTAKNFTPLYADGQVVSGPIDETYQDGKGANIPMIIGTTNADGFFFGDNLDQAYAPVGAARAEAEKIYDPENKHDAMRIGEAISADMMLIEPARHVTRIISQKGQPVYAYRYGYVPGYLRTKVFGAAHSSELPFVFDNVEVRHGAMTTEADNAEARLIHDYWVNFAKTGVPSSTSGGEWSKYDTASDDIMIFDTKGAHQQPDPFRTRLDFAERLATMSSADTTQPK